MNRQHPGCKRPWSIGLLAAWFLGEIVLITDDGGLKSCVLGTLESRYHGIKADCDQEPKNTQWSGFRWSIIIVDTQDPRLTDATSTLRTKLIETSATPRIQVPLTPRTPWNQAHRGINDTQNPSPIDSWEPSRSRDQFYPGSKLH